MIEKIGEWLIYLLVISFIGALIFRMSTDTTELPVILPEEQIEIHVDNYDEEIENLEQQLIELDYRIELLETYLLEAHKDDRATLNQSRIKYTEQELLTLETLVEHEAGGESYECKLMVASVVVNRVLDDRFPDTLTEVIFDKEPVIQFTPSINLYKEPSQSTKDAVGEALIKDFANGAWLFNNKDLTNKEIQQWFEEFEIVANIDDVQFRR